MKSLHCEETRLEFGILIGFIAKKIIMRSKNTLKHLFPTPSQLSSPSVPHPGLAATGFLGSQAAAFEVSGMGERLWPHSGQSAQEFCRFLGFSSHFLCHPLVPVASRGNAALPCWEKHRENARERAEKGFISSPLRHFTKI